MKVKFCLLTAMLSGSLMAAPVASEQTHRAAASEKNQLYEYAKLGLCGVGTIFGAQHAFRGLMGLAFMNDMSPLMNKVGASGSGPTISTTLAVVKVFCGAELILGALLAGFCLKKGYKVVQNLDGKEDERSEQCVQAKSVEAY